MLHPRPRPWYRRSLPGWILLNAGGSAVQSPSFVSAASSISSATLTLTGLKAGDLVVGVEVGTTSAPSGPLGWWITSAPATWTAGTFIYYLYRIVTPSDGTTVTLPTQATPSYAAAAFRHVVTTDGVSALNTGTSTAPSASSFTSLIANDIVVNLVATSSAAGTVTYAPSTGFTIATNLSAVFNSNFCVAIEYKLCVAAGTVPASSGAVLSASNPWGMVAIALHP